MLLERERELALLDNLLESLPDSGGKVVLIRGEAGIGKSALVKSFIASVEDHAHIHVGFCDDLQTPQPFGPLWDMARDNSALLNALRPSDRQEVMRTMFDLLAGKLRPNLVVIEDTQWSDEATLDAIKYVGRRVARTNGLLVLTYRDEEVSFDHPLRTVLGSLPAEYVERIELAELSRDAVAQIVSESGLNPDSVLEITHGNPFFVTEMALTAGDAIPSSVRDSVMARVGHLSSPSRELMRYMSVTPERITRTELVALVGSVDQQLAECERLGLLEMQGETVAFRHELIRRAVESSLTISEKVAIHRALLALLPDETDPARLVHHAKGANDVDLLVELVPRAAAAAAEVRGHREASAHYRTLEPHLGRLGDIDRARLLVAWAEIEYYLANTKALDLLDEAIDLYRKQGSQRDLAETLAFAVAVNETHARTTIAEAYALEAIAALEAEEDPRGLADAYSRYADLLLHKGEGVKADEYVEKALATGEPSGNELAVIRALIVKGMLDYIRGRPGGRDLVEQARQRAERGNHHYEEVTALRSLAYSGQEQDDIDLQQDVAQRARAAAIRYEYSFLEIEANSVFADALMRKGRWDEAEDLATENVGSHANADIHLMRVLGLIRLRRGRSGGQDNLEKCWSLALESGEIDYLLHVATALAEARWLGHEVGYGRKELHRLIHKGIEMEFPWLAGALASWFSMLGWLEPLPEGLPEPHARFIRGDWGEAAAHWESKGMPYDQAIVLSRGDTESRLRSLEILDSLGAEAVAAKVRKELRQDGVKVPRGKGRATREHAAGLTARQAEVLRLLGEGLSNPAIADRLFLSPRTVENHVSAVLAKLDSSTREQAVERALEQGLLEATHT